MRAFFEAWIRIRFFPCPGSSPSESATLEAATDRVVDPDPDPCVMIEDRNGFLTGSDPDPE